MTNALTLLRSPRGYFTGLAASGEVPWLLGTLGFVVTGLADPSEGSTSMAVSFLDAVVFAVIGCYVGSRALGGRAKVVPLVIGVGAALFWPSLFVLPIAYAILAFFGSHPFFLPIYLGAHLLFVIWSLELSYEVVRGLNGFGAFRSLAVILWSIVIGIPALVLLLLFTPSF